MKVFFCLVLLFLVSCGGGGGNNPSTPSPVVSISSNKSSLLVAGSVNIQWSSSNSTSCTASGNWSGSYATSGSEAVNISTFGTNVYTMTCVGSGGSDSSSISVSLNTDPLYKYQWHLKNTGQTNFASSSGGTADLNIENVISSGITGRGTIVAILDTGLELTHEDLSANIVVGKSYDYTDQDNNPEPTGDSGDHGTTIAGLISAVGGNNIGIRGVAPGSKIIGLNILDGSNFTSSNMIDALGGASGLSLIHI